MTFSSPMQGDNLKPATIVGHLLIVRPLEFCPIGTTGVDADGIRCDVADLDAADDNGQRGTIHRDVVWFGKMIVPGLKRQIGELVLARMGQGIAKGKNDPPSVLVDAVADAGAVALAQSWLAAHPEFEGKPSVTSPASAGVTVPPPVTAWPAPVTQTITAPPAAPASPFDQLSAEQKAALRALGVPVP